MVVPVGTLPAALFATEIVNRFYQGENKVLVDVATARREREMTGRKKPGVPFWTTAVVVLGLVGIRSSPARADDVPSRSCGWSVSWTQGADPCVESVTR